MSLADEISDTTRHARRSGSRGVVTTQLFAADEHAPRNLVRLMSRRMACPQGEFHRGPRCHFPVSTTA
jgi:hypothetical protein